jgi:hypothetical protein
VLAVVNKGLDMQWEVCVWGWGDNWVTVRKWHMFGMGNISVGKFIIHGHDTQKSREFLL